MAGSGNTTSTSRSRRVPRTPSGLQRIEALEQRILQLEKTILDRLGGGANPPAR